MAESDHTNTIRFKYKFQFDDGTEKEFVVLLDAKSLGLLRSPNPSKPEWTKLKYQQCENCPLDESVEHCPVALNISNLVDEFKFLTSHDKTWVIVEAPERTYAQDTSVQNGLASIMGIYMTTSDCPVLDRLRPMVRFHLPFATATETVYRVLSMHLVAQYFRMRQGSEPDWKLDKLLDLYRDIGKVNKGLWNRLSKASSFDANVNALIVLNTFGDALRFAARKDFDDLAPLFGDSV
ncbi:MAG TPA: hypothetical protein VMM57_04770 [Bacteroidota bacterium]|nr:hypothetical protein [Bacteroidota bacterium]